MRLALDPRARRLLRRLPHTTIYSALELLLLTLLAVQCARLLWTLVTPVDPFGDWKAASAMRPVAAAQTGLLASFDPFFRNSDAAAPLVVTTLSLTLHGVREDRATGRGAAIIGTPDGMQHSYAVGDEIMPGVVLTGVGFDYVTLQRGGASEQVYLDQSGAALAPSSPGAPIVVQPAPAPIVTPTPAPAPPASGLSSAIQYQARVSGTGVTGITVQPQGDGGAFRAAGLAPGDVIVAVNGQRINSAQQAQSIASRIGGGDVSLQVERDGKTIPLRVRSK